MSTLQVIFPVLVRPPDPYAVEILRIREDECRHRINARQDHLPYEDLYDCFFVLAEEACGTAILEILLEKHKVIGWDAAAEFFVPIMRAREAAYWRALFPSWKKSWDEIEALCQSP